jgi:hypothetical protein
MPFGSINNGDGTMNSAESTKAIRLQSLVSVSLLIVFAASQLTICLLMLNISELLRKHAASEQQLADAHSVVAASQNPSVFQLAQAASVSGFPTIIVVPQRAMETDTEWVRRYTDTITKVSAQ